MGTETELDVEGQTEPPICGLNYSSNKSDSNCNRNGNSNCPTKSESATLAEDTDAECAVGSIREGDGGAGPGPASGSILTTTDSNNPAVQAESAYRLTVPQVCILLNTDVDNGLDTAEATRRLQHYGPNKVEGAKGLSMWTIFLRQISNSLTLVCVFCPSLRQQLCADRCRFSSSPWCCHSPSMTTLKEASLALSFYSTSSSGEILLPTFITAHTPRS